MNYLLLNSTFESSSVIEDIVDNQILKDFPYATKYKTPILSYGNILIPYIVTDPNDTDFLLLEGTLFSHLTSAITITRDMVYSIFKVFKDVLSKQKSMLIDILSVVNIDNIGIIYSDGSSSKIKGAAGYGVCKLTEESTNGTYDDFTGKLWNYEAYSGRIENGTNNVGELTGVKSAIINTNHKPIQIIISDNIYSIKSFREYVYNWKNNGWLAYNKKPIKNKELIQETYNDLLNVLKDKLVLFKWTKGHAGDSFNEICDKLAKKESGVEE